MRYRKLGKSDLNISVVGLGTWAIGGDFWGNVDDNESIKAIQKSLDSGANLIDTAPAYGDGHSEIVVGKAIKGRRDDAIIATKIGVLRDGPDYIRCLKPESMIKEVEKSLKLLGIETIDLYQIHWPDVDTPLDDTLEALIKMHKEGKFRWLGVSNFSPELMKQVMPHIDLVSLQPPFSMLDRSIEDEILPFCIDNNIGVLSYGSLGGGILTGKFTKRPKFDKDDKRGNFYPYFSKDTWPKSSALVDYLRIIGEKYDKPVAQVAINWTVAQPGITCALVGAKNAAQAEQNAQAGDWELDASDVAAIQNKYIEIFG